MPAITAHIVGKRLLRWLGYTSLDPNVTGSQLKIRDGDIDDVAGVMSAAAQETFDDAPEESRQMPSGGLLRAATTVSLTATYGSTTISSLTTYAAWQLGCTIRINGDDNDNEILSETELARPFIGATGSGIAATIYADCIPLEDDTIGKILSPMYLPNQLPLYQAGSREEFLRLGGWPRTTDGAGGIIGFWNYGRKPAASQPSVWFMDSTYNAAAGFLPRRIRFSPMPTVAQVVAYTALMNPPRIEAVDIRPSATDFSDPGAVLPIPDSWVESIYMPICLQLLTGLETFKNEAAKPEIARAYRNAKNRLINMNGSPGALRAVYPR